MTSGSAISRSAAKRTAKHRTAGKTSKAAAQLSSRKLPKPAAGADFAPVFSALRSVLAARAGELHVAADEPRKYYVVTKSLSWKGGHMYFGAVVWGKAYVSYHLMPLYVCPELAKTVSPELKRRMQGKNCFNFRSRDEALFAELGEVTKSGVEAFRGRSLL
jgi:hypothetical protein